MAKVTNRQRAIDFGECFANNIFNMMLDPNKQGDKFSWDEFPQNFENTCRSSLFQIYSTLPKNIQDLEKLAGKSFITAGEVLKKNFPRKLPSNKNWLH